MKIALPTGKIVREQNYELDSRDIQNSIQPHLKFFPFLKKMKRFLNVVYEQTSARINVTDMEDLSEVQEAVEIRYVKTFPEIDAIRIQFYDKEKKIDDLDNIPAEYYKKRKEGGLELVIKLLPSPSKGNEVLICRNYSKTWTE